MTDTVGILPAYPDENVKYSESWFIYRLNLGETRLDAVRLVNNKDETVVLKIYPVDAEATTSGGFALQPEESPRKDIGGWVTMSANEIELAPQSEKIVPFTVSIPKDADVGDHAGGIVVQEVQTVENMPSFTGMRIINRVGVRIYETVPGEVIKDFAVTRFDWYLEASGVKSWWKDLLDINRKTLFIMGIKNKGNVSLSPKVTVDVTNMLGMKKAHLVDQDLGVVFPNGENSDGVVFWEGAPFFGRYKIKATVNFLQDGVGSDSREVAIWVFPYRMIFLGIILVVLVTLVRLIGFYFRESSKERMPVYRVKAGDSLTDLGRRFMAPWRKIAKLNFIGEPFDIKEGEKLFIPIGKRNRELLLRLKEQGELLPSIIERANESKFKKKKMIIGIILSILIIAGAVWGIKLRRDKMIREQFNVPKEALAPPTETTEKTKSGAYKKSSVGVVILTPGSVDGASGEQLLKKFKLMNYNVKSAYPAPEKNYPVTTVEYRPDKKEQAEMVKNDLGLQDVNLQEMAGLEEDVAVYNLAPVSAYFDLLNAVKVLPNINSDSFETISEE